MCLSQHAGQLTGMPKATNGLLTPMESEYLSDSSDERDAGGELRSRHHLARLSKQTKETKQIVAKPIIKQSFSLHPFQHHSVMAGRKIYNSWRQKPETLLHSPVAASFRSGVNRHRRTARRGSIVVPVSVHVSRIGIMPRRL
jgi:hypothetical protein